jgi:thymidylate synthase (FAD)
MTTHDAAPSTAQAPEPPLRFRSDMDVDLIRGSAGDADVVFAARVSTQGEASLETVDADPSASAGLIRYLMRSRHGTPFEHNSMTFHVRAPLFVFREFQRHRIASYNEESGRYRELEPVFYTPGPDRKLVQIGKAGHYTFVDGDAEQHELVARHVREHSQRAYAAYREMLDAGIAREVARIVLPLNLYSSMYVTLNARSLMNFLSLRTTAPDSTFPSYPQREIEMVAEALERHWRALMPLTHAAFDQYGRVSP